MKNVRFLKQVLFSSFFGLLVFSMFSCGSSKNSQNEMMMQMMQMMQQQQQQNQQSNTRIEEQLTDVELYAQESPATRSAGVGRAFTESAAEQFARNDARAKFAEAIESAVLSAAKTVYGEIEEFAADMENSEYANDGGQKQNSLQKTVANQTVSNTVVAKKQKFREQNNRYVVYVCLEYSGDVAELTANIAENVKKRVSDKSRKRIEQNLQKFEDEIALELNKKGNN